MQKIYPDNLQFPHLWSLENNTRKPCSSFLVENTEKVYFLCIQSAYNVTRIFVILGKRSWKKCIFSHSIVFKETGSAMTWPLHQAGGNRLTFYQRQFWTLLDQDGHCSVQHNIHRQHACWWAHSLRDLQVLPRADYLILQIQLVIASMKDSWEWWHATFHCILNLPFSCLTVSYLFTLLSIILMFLAIVHYSCKLWITLDVNLRTEFFSPACLHSNMAPVTVTKDRQDPRKRK